MDILLKLFFSASLLIAGFSNFALAVTPEEVTGLLRKGATTAGFETREVDFGSEIGRYISIFLGLLGLIALIIVIYAGFLWMTAAGNEEKVTQAKTLMKNAVIGLVIISFAYALTAFVIRSIMVEGPS